MSAFIEATKWPAGFEPDDTTSLLQCVIVNERSAAGQAVGQHAHQTGQFVVALSGLVGLAYGEKREALPASSAVWVPPGVRHEGFLGEGAVSLYCHINPEWAAMMPADLLRLQLSPMVLEMLKRFADLPRRYPERSHEARLAAVLFEELAAAPKLPIGFAPLPDHPDLKRIAESVVRNPQLSRPVADWAAEAAMSARTLSRLVLRETGLSFGAWRLRIAMLSAAQMLLAGEHAEVAAMRLGYATPSAFSNAFRRVFGVSPSAFREGGCVERSQDQ